MMPSKLVSIITKPKNLRNVVLVLLILTFVAGIYHLYFGLKDSNQGSIPLDAVVKDFDIGDEYKFKKLRLYELPKVFNKKPKCNRIDIFKPDTDSLSVYHTLDFHGDWIRYRDYWDSSFENRYNDRSLSDVPPLKVIILPHSHNDPGWLETFEGYFHAKTKHIIDNAVTQLPNLPGMKFIWSEISFLSLWWNNAHPRKRKAFRELVKRGQIEIVTGGWVMTDEATVNLYSMIDQLVEGHQWVKSNLGVRPKFSWSIDPFGHGSVFPYVLKESGFDGMVIQRIHFAWKKWLAEHKKGDFRWVQRWDHHNNHGIICHNAPFAIYSIKHSCGPNPYTCLNFDFRNITDDYSENLMVVTPITRQNLKKKAELMLEQYRRTASLSPHNVALVNLGDDFRYSNLIEWEQQYYNYKKLIDFIKENKHIYNAEVVIGTLSDYFEAILDRTKEFPTFSGDFFAYSDVFSEGRDAYWSGYYGTRPFWKKLYRETENALRSAEFLFTFCYALASQRNDAVAIKVLTRQYANLVVSRRWLGLFAHHDATTGTSKQDVMQDYGYKLMEAKKLSITIQSVAISSLVLGMPSVSALISDVYLEDFGDLDRKIPLEFTNTSVRNVALFNSLSWESYRVIRLIVESTLLEVIGPNGLPVISQINPVVDVENQKINISPNTFELLFVARLPSLTVSMFQIRRVLKKAEKDTSSIMSSVLCGKCFDDANVFNIQKIPAGDIHIGNNHLGLVFDRNSGLLLSINNLKKDIKTKAKLSFGGYASVDAKSGAYLLLVDTTKSMKIPFPNEESNLLILNGPVSSEVFVVHKPIQLSTTILHVGSTRLQEAVYVQNKIDLRHYTSEVFMRVETDLDSTSWRDGTQQPTFYSDQSCHTFEKRILVESIGYHGNNYPVNCLVYLQDEEKDLRFSVMVDRSHGFSSMKKGRIETLVERRTALDDGRGMGEGVVDNRPTISNYILLFESIEGTRSSSQNSEYRSNLPTLSSLQLTMELSYPPIAFVVFDDSLPRDSGKKDISGMYPIMNHTLPCGTHILSLRTLSFSDRADLDDTSEEDFPSLQNLLVIQKLGYLCKSQKHLRCSNSFHDSLFYPNSGFNGLRLKNVTSSELTGINVKKKGHVKDLSLLNAKPFELKSFILSF